MGKQVSKLLEALEQEVVTGRLPPGARLDEASLAKRFGVSRTPVREALNRLAASGLVELRPRRGAVVAAPDLKQLLEMFEVMAKLEGFCGRLAARRMSEAEHQALHAAHEAGRMYVEAADAEAYYRTNVSFHEAIYSGCHNHFLGDQTRSLRNRLAPYRRLQLRQLHRIANSFREHEQVLRAIMSGDGDTADRLLQQHVTVQGGSFTDFVSSLPVVNTQPQTGVPDMARSTPGTNSR